MHAQDTTPSKSVRTPLIIVWLHRLGGMLLLIPISLYILVSIYTIEESVALIRMVLRSDGLWHLLTTFWFDFLVLSLFILTSVAHLLVAVALFRQRRWCSTPLVLISIPFIGYLALLHVYGLSRLVPDVHMTRIVLLTLLTVSIALLGVMTRKYLRGPRYSPRRQYILGALILSPLILTSLPLVYRDGPDVEDSHLRPSLEYEEVNENVPSAAKFLLPESLVRNEDNDEELPRTDWDTELMATDGPYISERFVEASFMKQPTLCAQYIRFSMLPEAPLHCARYESLTHVRRIAMTVGDHSISLANSGDSDAAYRYATSIVRMGHVLTQAHGNSIIHTLTALSIYNIGLKTLNTIVEIEAGTGLPDHVKDELRALRPTTAFIRDTFRYEYEDHRLFVLHYNDLHENLSEIIALLDYPALEEIQMVPQQVRTKYFFHPNNTLRYFTHTYEYLIEHGTDTCDAGGPEYDPKWEAIQRYTGEEFAMGYAAPAGILRPNYVGLAYAATRLAAVTEPIRSYCELLDTFDALLLTSTSSE